jgi:hypothetical protein
VLAVAVLLAGEHFLQDDGRALEAWARAVKHTDPARRPGVMLALDQSFHVVVLLALALLAAG